MVFTVTFEFFITPTLMSVQEERSWLMKSRRRIKALQAAFEVFLCLISADIYLIDIFPSVHMGVDIPPLPLTNTDTQLLLDRLICGPTS